MKRLLRRIAFFAVLTIAVALIALVTSVFLFKDRIINEFVREANKHLSTPVRIGKIDVSLLDEFPLLSIVCTDVYIEDSHPGLYPLFTADRVSFQLNPLEVWNGVYIIQGLRVSNSETNLKVNSEGENNFTIVRKTTTAKGGSFGFELRNVKLQQSTVVYTDLRLKQHLTFKSDKLTSSIRTRNDIYNIEVSGDVTSENMEIAGRSFLTGKDFQVQADLVYDDETKSLLIEPSTLRLNQASFSVNGTYEWKDKNLINIETNGENANIQSLISLFPEETVDRLSKYQSNGDVFFKLLLNGEISKTANPSLTIEFGCTNATIFNPDYQSRIESASVEGSYYTPDLLRSDHAILMLRHMSGMLNGEQFTADLEISNFSDPLVRCRFGGKIDATALLNFYPVDVLTDVQGSFQVDVAFDGRIELLKNKTTAQQVSTQGTVHLQNIDVLYGDNKIPVRGLTGDLQFDNNDLALSNVAGKLGNSDFVLNGFFKNVVTFIFFENQPVGIEADLKADFIDLDQIFTYTFGSESASTGHPYKFQISRNVNLNFNCDIGSLHYKRFVGRELRGDLLVKSQMAVSRNFSLRAMGGELQLSGIVDGQNDKAIDIVTTARLQNIYLDSAFYVFQNFNQSFIEDRHLKGQASADVSLELTLNENLLLIPSTLVADIGLTIKNGQLNNFEPMAKLDRYLDDEGLTRLRFSELRNDIHIENRTVYLPQMEVRSNVSDMVISGTHTFDQAISYRVITPLKKKKVIDPEAQLAIEDDPRVGPKLFLKIVGTTDNYRVLYDTEAVKQKIVSDLKKEVQELKDAFKTKGKQKQKELELEKDDYFDWDEN